MAGRGRAAYRRIAALTLLALACAGGRSERLSELDRAEVPQLTVYLVRHAQAYRNLPALLRPGAMSEQQLDALTPRGERQAEELAAALAGERLTAVLSSPAGRARQTAAAIARAAGLPAPGVEPALGALRGGATPAGAPATIEWRTAEWKAGRDARPEGGESLADGLARARARIEELVREQPGGRIALVSHAEVIAALLGHAKGTPLLERYAVHEVALGSFSVLTLYPAPRWRLDAESVAP